MSFARFRLRPLLWLPLFAAAGAGACWFGPRALGHLSYFRVSRVEVSGARLLAPHEVLASSHIASTESVWDDPAGWRAALLANPAIADAEVERRLPSTLRLRIREKEPAGLVQAPVLRPVTREGEILPIDPARSAVDLPLVRLTHPPRDREHVADPADRALLAEADRLLHAAPGLMARVSEIRSGRAGELVLLFSRPGVEAILPAGADADRLAQLGSALLEIERRFPRAGEVAARPLRLDLRWADQVVVRAPSRV